MATIRTRIHYIAPKEHVHKTVSDVQITDAFQPLGIVMVTMIVATRLMNLQNIVNQRVEHASVICSHVTMAIAYLEFISVMAIMVSKFYERGINES